MNRVDEALEYIKKLDINKLGRGRFDVDDDFYYSVLEYDTSATEPQKLESHRKWIDIQWIAEGEEEIDSADTSGLELLEDYDESRDIMFWKPGDNMMRSVLSKGSYVVLYPEHAHAPGINRKGPEHVVKIVGKVRIV
ncbi:MAG: YhcH/YjgK/YiaL family protein [Oscillospiraceae bacterium]|nr:YhcH/YjgK/YiaL family protein [Oscillospiraceae bacterium]